MNIVEYGTCSSKGNQKEIRTWLFDFVREHLRCCKNMIGCYEFPCPRASKRFKTKLPIRLISFASSIRRFSSFLFTIILLESFMCLFISHNNTRSLLSRSSLQMLRRLDPSSRSSLKKKWKRKIIFNGNNNGNFVIVIDELWRKIIYETEL